MQLLNVPAAHHDMSYSISMTGLLRLKEGRYKQRHNLPKELVQTPREGIISLRHYKTLPAFTPAKKKRKKVTTPDRQGKQVSIKKPRSYVIDKTQVTHRIKQYVNQMKGEKMLYFWTITFPQGTTDNAAFILLNKWLTRLRKERMIREYLWVTERQQNGTIHFHMVINHRMDVKKANRYMRASIMYSIEANEIKWTREQAKNYNGIDIAKDRKTRRVVNFAKRDKSKALSNYLTKYVTKNNTTFSHLAWHSSRGYSNLITQIRLTTTELHQSGLLNHINTKTTLEHEYFTFTRWSKGTPQKILDYFAFVNNHIQSILN